jgi:hypothetical protein
MPNTKDYLLHDHPNTLLPLDLTAVLVERCYDAFLEYVYQKVLNPAETAHRFLPQTRAYTAKAGLHLRRTVQLDPVATVYIYDLVYRNRRTFPADLQTTRKTFGYGFRNGLSAPVTVGFAQYKAGVAWARAHYRFAAKFDISTYFNSIYHHDLVAWFSGENRDHTDTENFGQLLREANSGRSLDCLPQGLHPCKMIGAEFLKFVDNSARLRSEIIVRLMDDFYIFSNNEDTILSDFLIVQELLGEKGLSLNAQKTQIGSIDEVDVAQEVDEIKTSLLRYRRRIISYYGGEEDVEDVVEYADLDEEQIEYLLELLRDPEIDEADAELVLVLLRDHAGDSVLPHLGQFLRRFPNLSRNVYKYCRYVEDRSELANSMRDFVVNATHVTEEQLFWVGKIAQDFLPETDPYADILMRLYEHPNSTDISRAKVLEIPDQRFGLPEIRVARLRTGESNWGAWAAAVGSRGETRIARNHKLGYFANGSPMNRLIADCIRAI